MIELTEYETDRSPQEMRMDMDIAVHPRLLHRELMCPICLDILKQTMTTRECLHRFCSVCIHKALRSNNKECPTCRKKLTTRRFLRPDPNFDLIISKLYLSGHDKVEECKPILTPDCEIILKALQGQEPRYIKCPHSATIKHLSQYLSIRPNMLKSPDINNQRSFKICIVADRAKGRYEMLPSDMKLEQIKIDYKLDPDKPMELYFYGPTGD